jgi:hypothetical protein
MLTQCSKRKWYYTILKVVRIFFISYLRSHTLPRPWYLHTAL